MESLLGLITRGIFRIWNMGDNQGNGLIPETSAANNATFFHVHGLLYKILIDLKNCMNCLESIQNGFIS